MPHCMALPSGTHPVGWRKALMNIFCLFTLLANGFSAVGKWHFYFSHVLAFCSCWKNFSDSPPFLVPSMESEMEIQLPYLQGVTFVRKRKSIHCNCRFHLSQYYILAMFPWAVTQISNVNYCALMIHLKI